MRKVIFGFLAIGLGVFYYFTYPPTSYEWLYGTWIIDNKVEESVIENFTFNSDGTMVFSNAEGIVYDECKYTFFTKFINYFLSYLF